MGNLPSANPNKKTNDRAPTTTTTNHPSLLFTSLATPMVHEDALYLLQQCAGAVIEDEESYYRVVSFPKNINRTLVLIHGPNPSRLAISLGGHDTWFATTATTIRIHDTELPELCLPSQSRILVLPDEESLSFLSHKARQRAVARYLAGSKENGENTMNNTINNASSLLPSLQASWLPGINSNSNNDNTPIQLFPLNSTQPIPFQNDVFEGHVLMIVKPIPPTQDPYWHARLFQHKKRRIVWQLQGKFRRPLPEGHVLYAGAELVQPMRLGLVTQGVARLLLKLVQRFHSNVHSSFGTDGELAHIVIPAFTAMERLIVTHPDQTPPRMGTWWDESPASMQFRKETPSTGTWNTTDTYSMEFFSMYIDLAQWKLVQLPVSGDVALQTFWGDSPVTIGLYAAPPKEQHTARNKQYAFGVQIQYGKDMSSTNEQLATETMKNPEEEDMDIFRWSGSNRPQVLVQSTTVAKPDWRRRESGVFTIMDDESTEEDAYYYFDAEEEVMNELSDERDTFVNERRRRQEELEDDAKNGLLPQIDDACPFWMEVCTSRGGYNKVFAIFQSESSEPWMLLPALACDDFVRNNKWIRKQMEHHFSPRISGSEWTRRALGLLVVSAKVDLLNELKAMKSVQASTYYDLFLQRNNHKLASASNKSEIMVQGFIARAISDRHWIEEWARVYPDRIEFFHPDKNRSHFQISSINGVKALSPEDCPNIARYSFLAIDTPGRTVYLMFPNESQRDEWIPCIQSCLSDDLSDGMISDNPAEEFLHKSTMWRCKNRRLLNCARFSFHSRAVHKKDPIELVTRVLRLALGGNATRSFLEAAASLKDTEITNLDEDKKLAFFLNLYHVMISHAFLVLGPPNWSLVWINYFNNVAYQVGDDIFSLTELEHCIIRSNMTTPSQFLSRFAIPKSDYGRMALTTKDCRINFALNCGSLSNPESILIFNETDLDNQLNAASRLYLQNVTAIRKNKDLLIQLPRICQWYRDDFGDSDEDLLKRIREFLPDSVRQAIKTTSAELSVRFLPYQFECRQFVSFQE